MNSLFPWKRVRLALFQYTRYNHIPKCRYDKAMEILPKLVDLCGHYTQNRRTMIALGIALMQKNPRLLATVCPDYTHHGGHYTYEGMGDGVPLLLRLHRDFLRKVCRLVPNLEVRFLIADHEADFAPLRDSVSLSRREFRERVDRSVAASSRVLQRRGWTVNTFTRGVPGYMPRVRALTRRLQADPAFTARFAAETLSRSQFYTRVGYPTEVWRERTIQIAAQYLVLGEYCARNKIIVCNHTTISLGWFQKAGAAFLENPITIH